MHAKEIVIAKERSDCGNLGRHTAKTSLFSWERSEAI